VPRFKFRAQAALDLRVREHDAALRELARAEAEQQQAEGRLNEAMRALGDAKRTADEVARTVRSAADLHWHRMWILRLDHERASRVSTLDAQKAAVADARAACLEAQRRRESLERFREKAYTAHLAGEAAVERKSLDELATQRFATKAEIET
jgi:flagellar export protein FliJ